MFIFWFFELPSGGRGIRTRTSFAVLESSCFGFALLCQVAISPTMASLCCSCRPQAHLSLVSSKPTSTSPRSQQQLICRNEFTSNSVPEASHFSDAEPVELRRSSAATVIRNAVCSVVSTAALVLNSPDMAMAATPYSQSQSQSERLQIGLLNGRIRPCPLDINPNCVSTSSSNQAYAFPWEVPASDSTTAVKKIESAILGTQKNAQILKVEDISDGKRNGKYMVAEVDGFLGRDTLEFLVRDDIVTYRSMANKVQYVYPFTTPLGDFGAQQKHIQALGDALGWLLPDFETTK